MLDNIGVNLDKETQSSTPISNSNGGLNNNMIPLTHEEQELVQQLLARDPGYQQYLLFMQQQQMNQHNQVPHNSNLYPPIPVPGQHMQPGMNVQIPMPMPFAPNQPHPAMGYGYPQQHQPMVFVSPVPFDNGPTIEQRTDMSRRTSDHVRIINKTGRTILIAYCRTKKTKVVTLNNLNIEKIAVNEFTEKLEISIGIPIDPHNIHGLCNIVMEKQRIVQGSVITVINPSPITQVVNFTTVYETLKKKRKDI